MFTAVRVRSRKPGRHQRVCSRERGGTARGGRQRRHCPRQSKVNAVNRDAFVFWMSPTLLCRWVLRVSASVSPAGDDLHYSFIISRRRCGANCSFCLRHRRESDYALAELLWKPSACILLVSRMHSPPRQCIVKVQRSANRRLHSSLHHSHLLAGFMLRERCQNQSSFAMWAAIKMLEPMRAVLQRKLISAECVCLRNAHSCLCSVECYWMLALFKNNTFRGVI